MNDHLREVEAQRTPAPPLHYTPGYGMMCHKERAWHLFGTMSLTYMREQAVALIPPTETCFLVFEHLVSLSVCCSSLSVSICLALLLHALLLPLQSL